MKVALYIEDGTEQIVLTPESDTEKMVLDKFRSSSRKFDVYAGGFYECQGGWVRQEQVYSGMYDMDKRSRTESNSVIIRFLPVEETDTGD